MSEMARKRKESPSQTAGPYVHIGCAPNTCGVDGLYATDLGSAMIADDTPGQRITITGHIYDGAGDPLKDALMEIWQADHQGSYSTDAYDNSGTSFTGWRRQITNLETGRYTFNTIKPGPVPASDGRFQAPHLSFWIVARGINLGLNTRMYFPDESEANAACPVLERTPPQHRDTLIAHRDDQSYRFDIHLQGDNETVFFDI